MQIYIYVIVLGYIDNRFTTSNGEPATESSAVPTTPPSTYDYVLKEVDENEAFVFLYSTTSKVLIKFIHPFEEKGFFRLKIIFF